MAKLWQLAAFLLLFSCGSREVTSQLAEKRTDKTETTKTEQTASASIREKSAEFTEVDFSSLNLTITPAEKDTVIKTEFIYLKDKNGNEYKIPTKTNSKIEFGTQKSGQKTIKNLERSINSISKRNSVIEAKIKSYEKTKETQVKKKAAPFMSTLVMVLSFVIVSIFIWEMFRNDFLSIFRRLLLLL